MMQPRWNTAILLKIYNGLNRRLMKRTSVIKSHYFQIKGFGWGNCLLGLFSSLGFGGMK